MNVAGWLATLSAVQTALLALITFASVVGGAALKGWLALRKQMKEMQAIGPTAPSTPPPDAPAVQPVDVLRERVALLETQLRIADWDVREMRERLDEIGRDHARTAAELTRTREENERLRVYVSELEQHRRETDSGYTRLAGSYPPAVTEIDARPTPPRGTRRPR